MNFPADAALYWQPAGFIDSPVGLDGQFARLAGGMQFFSAWQVTAVVAGRRAARALVPIDRLDAMLATLTDPQRAEADRAILAASVLRPPLRLGERTIPLDQPRVMAILNRTPDSFSDGGRFADDESAAAAGAAMAEAGAAIVDVGGESTRPGAAPVWEGDELARVVPVIERLARAGVAVSVDTRKAAVMTAGLAAGAAIINDVSALLHDDRALEVVTGCDAPVVLMHAPSAGADPHAGAGYGDALLDVYDWLKARAAAVIAAGVAADRIILDPGIGFGKALADNLALLNGLPLFHTLGFPLLVGASRKRLIGALSNEAPAQDRLAGSLTLAVQAAAAGCQLIRVHDVAETVQALRVWRGLRDAALAAG